jgi:hypothetical protein
MHLQTSDPQQLVPRHPPRRIEGFASQSAVQEAHTDASADEAAYQTADEAAHGATRSGRSH